MNLLDMIMARLQQMASSAPQQATSAAASLAQNAAAPRGMLGYEGLGGGGSRPENPLVDIEAIMAARGGTPLPAEGAAPGWTGGDGGRIGEIMSQIAAQGTPLPAQGAAPGWTGGESGPGIPMAKAGLDRLGQGAQAVGQAMAPPADMGAQLQARLAREGILQGEDPVTVPPWMNPLNLPGPQAFGEAVKNVGPQAREVEGSVADAMTTPNLRGRVAGALAQGGGALGGAIAGLPDAIRQNPQVTAAALGMPGKQDQLPGFLKPGPKQFSPEQMAGALGMPPARPPAPGGMPGLHGPGPGPMPRPQQIAAAPSQAIPPGAMGARPAPVMPATSPSGGGGVGLIPSDLGYGGQLNAFLQQPPEDRSKKIPKSLGGIDLGDEERKQIGLGRQVLDALYGTDTAKMTTPAMIIGALQALGTGFNTFANAHWDQTPGGGQVTGPSALGALQAYGQQSGEVAKERENEEFIESMIANAKTPDELAHWQAVKAGEEPYKDEEAVWRARQDYIEEQDKEAARQRAAVANARRRDINRAKRPIWELQSDGREYEMRVSGETGSYEYSGNSRKPKKTGGEWTPQKQRTGNLLDLENKRDAGTLTESEAYDLAARVGGSDPEDYVIYLEDLMRVKKGLGKKEDPWGQDAPGELTERQQVMQEAETKKKGEEWTSKANGKRYRIHPKTGDIQEE